MNKRIKKKQQVVRYRKAYKALKKYCQRRRLAHPKYDWHLPKFKKWKERVIVQRRIQKIFGIPPCPMYPSSITSAVVRHILETQRKRLFFEIGGND